MDMYEIESTFNNFLDMADTLDYQEGAGIKLLSNGSSTTRQALKNEVGLFMLSLVEGLNYVTYEQKHLLDLTLEKGFEDADSDNILQMADSINAPYGGDNVTINAFVLHDLMSTKTTHEYTTSASNAMIGIFRLMGKAIMTAGIDTTSLSETRFDNYISNLELKAVTARSDLEDTANELIKAQEPEKPAPKTGTAASTKKTTTPKKTTGKKSGTSKKTTGGKQDYNEMISFMLPSGYQMDRETNDDGQEKIFIRFGLGEDDNGNPTWEFSPEISPIEIMGSEEDKIPAGESPLQTMIRRNNKSNYVMISEKQKAAILSRAAPLNILGRVFKFYALMLIVEQDDHHVISLTNARVWDDEDQDVNLKNFQHMIDMIGAIRINGDAVPPFTMTAEKLMEKLAPEFEGVESIKGSIGLQIKNGDEVVSESVLVGDDDGTVHRKHTKESRDIADGKYGDLEIKNGWVTKCLKKAVTVDIPEGVVGIEDNAFEKCTKLEKVTIPDGVTAIGTSAFDGCSKLKEIIIPDSVSTIGMWAFNECKNLLEVKLPASMTFIGMYTFHNCEKLKSVTIPPSVTTIYTGAFQYCKSLTEITLPDGLEQLGEGVFWGCEKLAKVNIPDGIKEISANLFNQCKSLKSIKLPAGITEIGYFAFAECEKLESIEIPDSMDKIGEMAFYHCKKLKKIALPSGLTVIDENVFSGCDSLTEVILPEELDEIKSYAFSDCVKLKKCEIPAGVSQMENGVFDGCKSLECITVPSGITGISDFLCNNCSSLKKVTFLGDVEKIGKYAFSGCSSLSEIDLPDSLTEIGDDAFDGCQALTSVEIPDNVEKIGGFAFDSCDNLKEISMPGRDVELGNWALPDEDQAKITYRAAGGRKTTRKPNAKPAVKAVAKPKTAGRFTIVTPDDEIYTHYGKLKREHEKFSGIGVVHVSNNGREHEAIPLAGLMERQGKTDNATYKKLKAFETNDRYDLKETALKIAQVFRVEESLFNSRHDDECDIAVAMLEKKWKFSALRSFAWTLADMADREGKNIDDYDIDDYLEICSFIEGRQWLNYEAGSWFDALCGHPDIHVYYMPGSMIADGSAEEICNIFNYNPIVSLDDFRNDLGQLKNAMIRIHNKLLETRDRSVRLDSPESAVLDAWCAMVVSAETPFFSEDGPMMFFHEYPKTPLNTKPIPVDAKAAVLKKASPKKKAEEPSSAMQNARSYEIIKGPDGKDRIKLGEYPIGQPIIWLVMENNSNDLLLLSEYGLDAKAFNDTSYSYEKTGSFGDNTNEWHNCSLRQWLNEEFCDEAFTQEEKRMILDDTHDTFKMSSTGDVEMTPSVTDKVWLLSAKEGKQYFADQRAWICIATDFAKEQGAEIENGPMQCHWWMRSPGVELMPGLHMWVACAMASGEVKGWGNSANNVCVRPVIRVKKDLLNGSATTTANTITEKKTATKSTTAKATTKKTTTAKSTAAKSTTKKTTSTKTSSTSKTKSAAAPKEMSVYSPEYKKAMKERLLPGEKDLPSEIYCNKIDFRAGDIAENGIRFNLLKDNGPVIEKHKYFLGKVQGAYLEIPEGVTEIESSAFSYDEFQIVKLPRSLRILKQGAFSQCPNLRKVVFQEGIRELGPIIFGECPNIKEVHLPGTVEIIDDSAFKWELLSRRSDITVYLTGASAKKVYENAEKEGFDPPFARGFVIDGKSYSNLENYILASERERQAALERQRQEKLKRDEEARKTAQRNSLRQRISELEQERDSAKGLFAGMKRKKIQKEIDELRSQLQRI